MINIRYRSFQILVHYSSAFTIIYIRVYIFYIYKSINIQEYVHTSGVVIAHFLSNPSPDHIKLYPPFTLLHLTDFTVYHIYLSLSLSISQRSQPNGSCPSQLSPSHNGKIPLLKPPLLICPLAS